MTPLHVYKASAGSGKTFQLAKQYIKLVVSNPQAYRTILAVTFTNKATEEMKMRILSQLYGLWKMASHEADYPESKPYMDQVCSELNASPAFVSQRAGLALKNLLHNYNYFRVQTIDTFFQGVLRNLSRELDLTANLRIGLNDSQVEELAVDQLIDSLNTTDAMLQWIMKYIMDNISDDRSWNVIGQIKQFGKTIFRDYYKQQSQQLNRQLSVPGFFDGYTEQLRLVRQTARQRMADLSEQFCDTLSHAGLTTTDLANKDRGIASFFAKLGRGTFDESVVNQTVNNCLDDPSRWYSKSSPHRELIHHLATTELMPLLRTAVDERPRQWRLYQSAHLTLRHLSQLRLLSSIEQKVRELNVEANRFLLSDTQQLLATLISDSDTPFIFEKMGTQLEHIMIDEFQDTSTLQWQNFRVLLQETMSRQGSENLIVGDVKQSIYRWRSGDWRLLNNIEQQFAPSMVHVEPLDVNRRSERRVVAFNSLFFVLAEALERLELADMPEATQLKRAYADVEQQVPEGKAERGMVSVRLLATRDGDDYRQQMLQATSDVVSELLSHRVPQGKIAILVRTNNLIPLIASHLTDELPGVRVVSDEAFRLDASLAVRAIVQALHLLTHPDDTLARAFLEKALHRPLPHEFTDSRQELLNLPLYELAEQLFVILGLNTIDDQSAYVCAFFDQMANYVADNLADIDSFVAEWEETICSKTIQSDIDDGIRIISIHKSKGLEFDNVIIPFCDWQLERQSGNLLWCHPSEPPFSQLPMAPIDYSRKGMMGTIYEDDYRQEHLQNVVDNLNLLYVAFTRARSNLFVLGRRGSSNSRSAIIEQVLPLIGSAEPPRQLLDHDKEVTMLANATVTGMDNPDSDLCLAYGSLSDYSVAKNTSTHNIFLVQPSPIAVSIEPLKSTLHFRQSNQSQRFTQPDNGEEADRSRYIQLGSSLHYLFSILRTADDLGPAVRELQQQGLLPNDAVPDGDSSWEEFLTKRLNHPVAAQWFSPRWRLYNECTILTTDAQGCVREQRPDRVMTDGEQWIVVDFKFAKPRPAHSEQVRRYMRLIGSMGQANVTGYLWYVFANKIETVNL